MKVYEYVFKLTDRFSGPMSKFKRLAGQGQGQMSQLQRRATGFGTSAARAFGRAETKLRGLQRQTRRSSSAFSEMKNQVLGFVSAWAAFDFGRQALNTAADVESLRNAISFASGSAVEAGQTMPFLNQVINSLGLDAMSAYEGFKILAGSMKDTVLQGQGTRAIFQAVATASTAMGLSADNTKGALIAIGQMMSKGKVSAEELTQQLGERLPGALGIAARAMDMNTQELLKMMSEGKLMAAQFLPAFATELQKTFVDGAATAATGLRAAMNRAGNAFIEVKEIIGNQLAPTIMQLSGQLVQAAHWLKQNWSTVMAVGKAFLWAAGIFAGFKLTVALLSGGLTLLTSAMTLGRIAALAFTGQFAALNVVMAANPIGLVAAAITALIAVFTWAYNKFEWFKGGVWGLWEAFKEVFSSIGEMAKEIFGGITTLIAGIFSGNFGLANVGLKQLSGTLGKIGSNVAGAFSSGYQTAVAPDTGNSAPKVPGMPDFNMPGIAGMAGVNGGSVAGLADVGAAGSDSSSGARNGISAITGGGKRVTNIVINNPKVAENMSLEFATADEGMSEMESKMKKMLASVLNDFNRSSE